jgi:hypothetical protein
MNHLRNGSIAVGAPGSPARIAAEAADNALGLARQRRAEHKASCQMRVDECRRCQTIADVEDEAGRL